ncbi:AraC family transcriptional regulator [Olivibacter ginsenosidimutans]|uniref:AraC family transcriptional regulator n=1 Tax=Olivibacter ginsenosidimutans TaxID=1176537 RepID=A0ABP9CHP2_9SPHI
MKATYESVYNLPATSFTVRRFEEKYFSAPYHFHPELELTFIIKGAGKRYVGGRIDDYDAGDLVLLGENLPHCWKTELVDDTEVNSISMVVHFNRDFLGTNFFTIPEMKRISKLLHLSKNGLYFTPETACEIGKSMEALVQEQNTVARIGLFLNILDRLSFSTDFKVLEQQNLYEHISVVEREKINKVSAFIVDHFQKPITIEEAASLVHLSPHAFCKYFKKVTRKTFMETVIDYRIDFATQRLCDTDLPVTQIAFESGFADLSNFYRTFKKRKQLSPLAYRKVFLNADAALGI